MMHALASLLVAALIAVAPFSVPEKSSAAENPAAAPAQPSGRQGMWVWNEEWVSQPAEQDRLLDFADRYGFNLLLVQIHLKRGADEPTVKFPAELKRLVTEAAKRGIAVEALDGGPDQADVANQSRTLAILDAVLELNAGLPDGAKLAGMHYDIEPYVRPEWKDPAARQVIMRDLLTFYAAAGDRIAERAPDMTLAADIPFWYDNHEDASLEFAGTTKPLYQHIIDVCDYIGIMSYRRHATGPNSVTEHVATEMDYAKTVGKTVCPSLETIELEDTPQITFHGLTAADFWAVHNEVRAHLADHPAFGGMLTHHYVPLRALLEPAAQ